MDCLSKLVISIALAFSAASSNAGYAQLAPPPGFTAPLSEGARYGYAAANEAAWVNQTVRTTASLNVGGQAVKVPVYMRLAANAPRFAAAAIFLHPGVRTAIGVLTLLQVAKVVWDESQQKWVKQNDSIQETDGYHYRGTTALPWSNTASDACNALLSLWPPSPGTSITAIYDGYFCVRSVTDKTGIVYKTNYSIIKEKIPCPSGWETTPAGCLNRSASNRPLNTPDEFIPEVINPANNPGWPLVPADWPMPSTVPNELPNGTPLPVEQPIINPTPGDNPQPQPYFVPTGDPVPNPNYDPNAAPSPENQPWFQPGVRIVPSPTVDNPWRVDMQPVNRPTDSPVPKTPEQLNPQPDPATDPATDPAKDDKPKDEDKQDLCEKHPEILACQNLDEPEDKPLEDKAKEISITPDSGWGAENATCPAPKMLHIQGREVAIPYDLFCQYMQGIRPIVLAMAWLSAAFILLGVKES